MSFSQKVSPGSVLIVDDDENIRRLFEYNVGQWGYSTQTAGSGGAMMEALAKSSFDILLLDLRLPDGDGIEFLPHLRREFPRTQVIMVTAHGNVDLAMEAIHSGAYDFLTKPVSLDRLQVTLRNGLSLVRTHEELSLASDLASQRTSFGAMIGGCPAMQALYTTIENVAASDCSVMIVGETGTGKELVAQEIHQRSKRKGMELVTVNCAAIPSELLESEMFGHEKGSFTGAFQQKKGCAEQAHRSTLFLDEIGEMDVKLQAKLLRFLQNYKFQRVGGNRTIEVDIRLISATNRNLQEQVKKGELREDLLYRIDVVKLVVPPLRERRPDIPLLATRFLRNSSLDNGKQFRSFSEDAMGVLVDYPWPGNVRQLLNVVAQTVVLNQGTEISLSMLPAELIRTVEQGARKQQGSISSPPKAIVPLWRMEKEHMRRALLVCQGNVARAAEFLEVSKATLYRKIKEYDIGNDPKVES